MGAVLALGTSQRGKTALIWASKCGHLDAAQVLLDARASVESSDWVQYSFLLFHLQHLCDTLWGHEEQGHQGFLGAQFK